MSDRQRIRLESKRGFARGFVAILLALFTLGWLAERAHVAFEAHEFCAEHQRVEHASDRVHAEAAHEHSGRGPVFEALDRESDAHAACCTLLGRSDDPIALPSFATRAFLAVTLERVPVSRGWSTSALASLDIVRFAPKQSPPAV